MEDTTIEFAARSSNPRRPTYTSLASPSAATSSSGWSGLSASPMSLMITTSQHASPASLDHPLKVATTRAAMHAASHIGLHSRASLGSPLIRRHRGLRVIAESPASNIMESRARKSRAAAPESESEQSSVAEEPIGGAVEAFNAPLKHSPHATALPRGILGRIFDWYAENLWQDKNHLPFAILETLLLVCTHWRNVAEQHGSIWVKFHIDLLNRRDVGKWITRIRRRRGRIGTHPFMDISIQDERDLSSYETLIDPSGSGLSKAPTFLAHLNDLVSLITELGLKMDAGQLPCRWRSFRLAMPSNFPEIVNRLDSDTRDVASTHLNDIFSLNMLFLESLELENVAWTSPTEGFFTHSQLPPIFQGFINSIKELHLYYCFLPSIPIVDEAHELHLEHCSQWNGSRKQWEPVGQINDSNDLVEIQILTDLRIFTIGPLTARIVPLYLSSLQTLEIIAWWGHELAVLTHISTLSLESLHTLIISWPDTRLAHLAPQLPAFIQPDVTKSAIAALFSNAREVTVIEAPKTTLISVLSFLYEQSSTSSPLSHESRHMELYEPAHKIQIRLTGDESAKQLKDIALHHFHLSLPHWNLMPLTRGKSMRRAIRGTSVDLEPIFGDTMSPI